MGMAWAYQKGDLALKDIPEGARDKVKDLAKHMKKKDLSDFAHTPRKKLPEKVTKLIDEILKEAKINVKAVSNFGTYVSQINWNNFTSSDMMQEDFGACIVNFYAEYFTGLDRTDFKIKKNVDAILKNIRKGAMEHIKAVTEIHG